MRRAKPGGSCCIRPLRGIAVAWAETATRTRLDLLLTNVVSNDLLGTEVSILDTIRGWSQSEESENACKVAGWWWGGSGSVTRAQVRAWTKQHHAHCLHVHKQHLHHMLVLGEVDRVPITRKNEQTLSWSSKKTSYCHTIVTSPCDPRSGRREEFSSQVVQAGRAPMHPFWLRWSWQRVQERWKVSQNRPRRRFPQVVDRPILCIVHPSSCLLVLNVSE